MIDFTLTLILVSMKFLLMFLVFGHILCSFCNGSIPYTSCIKVNTSFSSSSFIIPIHSFPTLTSTPLLFFNRALKNFGVVYGCYFHSDSYSLHSSSCWNRLKINFLCHFVFFYYTNDFW